MFVYERGCVTILATKGRFVFPPQRNYVNPAEAFHLQNKSQQLARKGTHMGWIKIEVMTAHKDIVSIRRFQNEQPPRFEDT